MLPGFVLGQSFPEPKGFVNDFKLLFTPAQRSELDAFLTDFAQTTSNEISVVTINLPSSEEKAMYTTEMAQAWGIGGKKNDNGVLLAVYPNTREVFIAVGYGLEGALPDIVIKNIIDQHVLPAFRGGDYYGGVREATEIMAGIVKGEYDDAPLRNNYYNNGNSSRKGSKVPDEVIVFIVIVLILILANINRGKGGGGGNGGRRGRGYNRGGMYWWGTGGGSSWGGGGSSSWGGGGGFGGFGGGGFGGGGAGGSW